MDLYKIIIYTPDGKYFHEEEIYCESVDKCEELYKIKYPDHVFEIKKMGVV